MVLIGGTILLVCIAFIIANANASKEKEEYKYDTVNEESLQALNNKELKERELAEYNEARFKQIVESDDYKKKSRIRVVLNDGSGYLLNERFQDEIELSFNRQGILCNRARLQEARDRIKEISLNGFFYEDTYYMPATISKMEIIDEIRRISNFETP